MIDNDYYNFINSNNNIDSRETNKNHNLLRISNILLDLSEN
jgi:hypothetical protein